MIDATTIMKFLSLFAVLFVALSPVEAQTTVLSDLRNSPLAFTGRANNVSVYSRETNRITCMARGTAATWLGTRQGIKRLDTATGAVRVYSAGDGLPWGAVQSIATDDAGNGAVALVYSTPDPETTLLLFCLYDPKSDRWQILTQLPYQRPNWFASMPEEERRHFRVYPPNYHVAIGEKYAVLVPYISTAKEPFVLRYDRATGKVAEPVVAPNISDGDAPFIATKSIARYREILYAGTNCGLYAVSLDTGNIKRHFPRLEVLKVAVPPQRNSASHISTLWLTAVTRYPGRKYGDEERAGSLYSFSLMENHPVGEPVSLNGIGDLGTWQSSLRVGEDGFPYLIRTDRFARYEPQIRLWRYFDMRGQETTATEAMKRYRSAAYRINDFPLVPATVIPDSIAAERTYGDAQTDSITYYQPDSLHWMQNRFPAWLTPDARATTTPNNTGEYDELKALPVSWERFENRITDPFIPHREWSVTTQGGVPQLWKWDTTMSAQQMPPAMTLYDQYLMETSDNRAKNTAGSLVAPTGPMSKIALRLPALRRTSPYVTGLRTIWQTNATGDRQNGTIVETKRGSLWLNWLGNNGDCLAQWLTPDNQKELEATDQKQYVDLRPLSSDAPAPPVQNPSGRPPILRTLENQGGSHSYHLIVGSPYLWHYDNSERKWTQKAALPVAAQAYIASAESLKKLPATVLGRVLIGDANGLWVYDGIDNHDQWIPVLLPPKFDAPDATTVGVVATSDFRLRQVAVDKQNIFIAGSGQKNNDPPILIRWNKKTGETAFLTEGTHGIPALRGGPPLLMGDGEAVWYALQKRGYQFGGEGDVSGGYRWNGKTNQFIPVTTEPVVAMETDTANDRDVYLLTNHAILRWHRKTGKTTRFALPTEQTTQRMLQTSQTIYVVAQDALYAWNKKMQQWRLVTNIPRVSNDARLHLANEKALWLYDGSTAVRVMFPAP